MELLKVQQKNSIGIFAVTTLLAIVVLFFLTYPKFSDYNNLSAERKANADSLQAIQNQQQQVNVIFAKMQQSQTDLSDLDLALPNQPNIPDLYALIENQAKYAGLNLTSVQAIDLSDPANKDKVLAAAPGSDATGSQKAPPPLSPTLGQVSVNLQLIGDLNGFTQFLKSIQQSMRLVDVQSVDISTDAEKKIMTFNLVLMTYYQK